MRLQCQSKGHLEDLTGNMTGAVKTKQDKKNNNLYLTATIVKIIRNVYNLKVLIIVNHMYNLFSHVYLCRIF